MSRALDVAAGALAAAGHDVVRTNLSDAAGVSEEQVAHNTQPRPNDVQVRELYNDVASAGFIASGGWNLPELEAANQHSLHPDLHSTLITPDSLFSGQHGSQPMTATEYFSLIGILISLIPLLPGRCVLITGRRDSIRDKIIGAIQADAIDVLLCPVFACVAPPVEQVRHLARLSGTS